GRVLLSSAMVSAPPIRKVTDCSAPAATPGGIGICVLNGGETRARPLAPFRFDSSENLKRFSNFLPMIRAFGRGPSGHRETRATSRHATERADRGRDIRGRPQ